MTSASVWPVAHVAFSHSRIPAMLITGTGMARASQNFHPGKSRNVMAAKTSPLSLDRNLPPEYRTIVNQPRSHKLA